MENLWIARTDLIGDFHDVFDLSDDYNRTCRKYMYTVRYAGQPTIT